MKLFPFSKLRIYLSLQNCAHALLALVTLALPALAQSQEAKFLSFIHDTEISSAIICSPDGKNVYVGGINTIAAFVRQVDGTLKTVQVLNNDHNGAKGIFYVVDLAVSPDGRHLYAFNSYYNHSLLLLERDPATGILTFGEAVYDSVFSKTRNQYPGNYKLLFSPDGRYLFCFFSELDLIAVFERNLVTGRIKKIQLLRSGAPELGGFNIPLWVAISPDGKDFYGRGGNETNLLILARNSDTGLLTYKSHYNLEEFIKEEVGLVNAGGRIAISPRGETVYLPNYSTDKLHLFQRSAATGELAFSQTLNVNNSQTLIFSPNGEHVYILLYSYLAFFKMDSSANQLVFVTSFKVNYEPPLPPSGLCMSPKGEAIYMNSFAGCTVMQRDTISGELKNIQHFQNNIGGTDRLGSARSVAVSPNGDRLYVNGRYSDAGINTFHREPQTGAVQLAHFDSLPNAGALTLSPDGRFLYASTHASSPESVTLETFAIDPGEGSLQWLDSQPATSDWPFRSSPYWPLTFSPQAEHLYVGNKVFGRNPSSGLLTEVQTVDGRGHQLGVIYGSAVSPEGKHFYWLGEQDYSLRLRLGIFARDSLSGQLNFLSFSDFGYVFPAEDGSNYAAATIRISPDGRHAYATALKPGDCEDCIEEAELRIFTRNAGTGALTLVEKMALRRWSGIRDLELTANGDEVYVLFGCNDVCNYGEIAIFSRDAQTGKLTQRASLGAWENGAYGITSPSDLTLSPDENFFYVTDTHGLATFATGRTTTSVFAAPSFIPRALALEQNYPNPFTASVSSSLTSTTIRYEIPATNKSAMPVELAIYNLQGQLVRTLVDATQAPGRYSFVWNGVGAKGEALPAGLYFYRLKAGEQVTTKRLLLIR
ncbi:beta-propeller fold lactonase family protein [candidate division KSB1 bacterium]|nr:beta-propeller fold lactonase family protein [candidate division KSB1 bacterium]